MALLKRADISRPTRKAETVMVESLGGEVKVMQMTLPTYLAIVRATVEKGDTMPLARVLSECVVDADELPIFTEEEWGSWGVGHIADSLKLYNKIRELSGIDAEDAEKK